MDMFLMQKEKKKEKKKRDIHVQLGHQTKSWNENRIKTHLYQIETIPVFIWEQLE